MQPISKCGGEVIRFANMEDRDELLRIGAKYAKETILGALTDEQMMALVDLCLKCGVVLIAEREGKVVGIIAGRFVEEVPAMGKFFEEVLWYVEPESRGLGIMLFKRLLKVCEGAKCRGVSMWAYCNEHLDGVDRIYKRSGFKEIERKYYKKM